jgi:hypothetical protein
MEFPENGFTLYGTGLGRPGVAVTQPYDGGAAAPGNGAMVAIVLDDRGKVDAFHAKALELGGSDEGAPGLRSPEGDRAFYGAYFATSTETSSALSGSARPNPAAAPGTR